MRQFCAPNLDRRGRLVRGVIGLGLLAGAGLSFGESVELGVVLAAGGLFGLFEAMRGWCLARACGIKTKL